MLKETQIPIDGKSYLIRKNYGSMLFFEEQTGKGITEMQQTLKDFLMLFFCIVKYNNENVSFNFLDFVKLIDNNPESMDAFTQFLLDSATTVDEPQEKKKKVRQSK